MTKCCERKIFVWKKSISSKSALSGKCPQGEVETKQHFFVCCCLGIIHGPRRHQTSLSTKLKQKNKPFHTKMLEGIIYSVFWGEAMAPTSFFGPGLKWAPARARSQLNFNARGQSGGHAPGLRRHWSFVFKVDWERTGLHKAQNEKVKAAWIWFLLPVCGASVLEILKTHDDTKLSAFSKESDPLTGHSRFWREAFEYVK